MILILTSTFSFLLTVFIHIKIYNYFVNKKIFNVGTLLTFFIGLILNQLVTIYIINNLNIISIPLTVLFYFIFLTIVYFSLTINIFSTNISPTYKIIYLLQNKNYMQYKDILKHYSNKELIYDRLNFLIRYKYIRKHSVYYKILPRGKSLLNFLNFYRNLMKWYPGG